MCPSVDSSPLAANPQLAKDSSHLAAALQLESQETSVSSSGKAGRMPADTSLRQVLSKASFRGSRFHREIGRSGVVRVFVVRAERRDAVTVQASNGAARIET
jgi:hypothetical protein